MYQESLEHFLEVWVSFIEGWSSATHPHSLPRNVLTLPLVEVFNAYIQSKLSAPRGWRDSGGEEASEIVEIEEDDRNTYMDELSSIGSIARTVAEHSLPLLLSVLEQCINECMHIYSLVRQDPNTLKSQYNNLDNLYEDLHWLTMIAGYTLCDIVKGEDVLVPTDLMQFSILRFQHTQQATNTGISISSGGTNGSDSLGGDGNIAMLSLQSMERGGVVGDNESVDLSKLDPVVSLVLSMCRLCVMEKLFISHGMIEILSPQLCDTTVWCLSRIVEPYLMLSEESYEQVCVCVCVLNGKDGTLMLSEYKCTYLQVMYTCTYQFRKFCDVVKLRNIILFLMMVLYGCYVIFVHVYVYVCPPSFIPPLLDQYSTVLSVWSSQ